MSSSFGAKESGQLIEKTRNTNSTEYSRRLKALRSRLQLSQSEMAQHLGISPRKIYELEQGVVKSSFLARLGLEAIFSREKID